MKGDETGSIKRDNSGVPIVTIRKLKQVSI